MNIKNIEKIIKIIDGKKKKKSIISEDSDSPTASYMMTLKTSSF